MNADTEAMQGGEQLRESIRRMYVDGELDANTATRRLLTLDSQRRASRTAGRDEAPVLGGG